MQWKGYITYSYCWIVFSSLGYVKPRDSNRTEKYKEMSQLFRLLIEDMKAKDGKLEMLENAVQMKKETTTINKNQTTKQVTSRIPQRWDNNESQNCAGVHSRGVKEQDARLERLQQIVQGSHDHLVRIDKGLTVEKSMRLKNTKSAEFFLDRLEQMSELFDLTMKRHEKFIDELVKNFKIDIKANKDDLNAKSDKISSAIDEIANNAREHGRAIGKITTMVEKILGDIEDMKPLVYNMLNVNLALGKSATESSSHPNEYNKGPEAATDGVRNGIWSDGSCTHTYSEMNPWWQVDLEKQVFIGRVVIWNRADCCGQNLHNLVITIRKEGSSTEEICGRFEGPSSSGATETIHCANNIYGRFLKIQIQSDSVSTLTLCEVELFSK